MALIAQKLDYPGHQLLLAQSRHQREMETSIPSPALNIPKWAGKSARPALRRLLNRINNDYHLPPIYITENGAAFKDEVSADGKVHDQRRLDYLKQSFHPGASRHAGWRGCARLLRLVPARQLRMGTRLHQTLRHRPRGLRNTETHYQGQRRVVCGRDMQERGGRVR
ncbi:MAG: family 1 glycosylhydrolase [Desulfosudis oleivorans]|nr:family 1 glycosylhydrolase [Desulfosudis oleivorans]